MNELIKKQKISEIFISILLFIIGICLLIWAQKVINVASIMLGIILIMYGAVNVINTIQSNNYTAINIFGASVKIVLGVILICNPSLLSEVISFIVGIFILISSIMGLSYVLSNKESNNFNLSLGLSIAGILIGILCILGKFLIPSIILQFIGLMLIIYSILNIVSINLYPTTTVKIERNVINVKEEDIKEKN